MNNIKNTCIICGNQKFKHKYYGCDYNYKTSEKEYEIIECERCGLEQIFPLPTFSEQQNFYPKNYYSYNKDEEKNNIISKIINGVFKIFKNNKFELPSNIKKGQNFLDIWCGNGFNLKFLKKTGSEGNLKGFEIGDHLYKKDNIYYGKTICDVDFDEKFDFIRCNHVFEHVDNPIPFLKKVHSIMNDNGIFILTLPNVKNTMSSLFGKYATDRDIPRHLFGYGKNIEKLIESNGFIITNKSKKFQYKTAQSFVWMINDKFFNKKNQDVRNFILLQYFIGVFGLMVDFIFSCLRETDQMSFIIKKS